MQQLPAVARILFRSVSVRAESRHEAQRSRMQAIKCVVVGDGYALLLLCLTSLSRLSLLDQRR